jgi:hypothetical protein
MIRTPLCYPYHKRLYILGRGSVRREKTKIESGWAWAGFWTVEEGEGQRQARPMTSSRGPIKDTCFEACSKRQPRERLVRAAVFRHPSSLLLPGLGWRAQYGPPWSQKNAATRAMSELRVFQPSPHHHCKIASSQKVGMLSAQDPPNTPFCPPALAAARPQWHKIAHRSSADAS